MLARIGKATAAGGIGLALLLPTSAWVLETWGGCDAWFISQPFDEGMVEAQRSLWETGQPVPPIYGQPSNEPIRVLFPDSSKLLIPPEDPSLTLLRVYEGDHPLQARTAWLIAKLGAIASLAAAAAGGLLLWWARRHKA
ncbi:MAG TPA: hypothetical protein VI643_01115 [Planctomycetota bacterium]|nr:hypothetical protein [Planctomycetota bacterium]